MAFNNIFDSSLLDYSIDLSKSDFQYQVENWIEEYNKITIPLFLKNDDRGTLKLNKNVFINDDYTINVGFYKEPTIVSIISEKFTGFPIKIKEFCNGGIVIQGCSNLKSLVNFPDKMWNATLILEGAGITSLSGFPKQFYLDKDLPDKTCHRIDICFNRNLQMTTREIIEYLKENTSLNEEYINYIIDENSIRHNKRND